MTHSLGVHREGSTLNVALIHLDKKEIKIDLLRSFDADVKPLYILEAVLEGRSPAIVSGLEASEICIREIPFKISNKRAILASLPFQAEACIPYPLDEAILLPSFYPQKEKQTLVNIISTSAPSLEKHLKSLKEVWDIDPDITSSLPNAIKRFCDFTYPEIKTCVFFHLGKEKSFIGIKITSRITLSKTLKWGSVQFEKSQDSCIKDLSRMIEFLKTKENTPSHLILTGEKCSRLKEALEAEFEVLDKEAEHALPIGLALEGLYQDERTAQFRQGRFCPEKTTKKRKKTLLSYASVCLAMTLFIWGASHLALNKKEQALETQLNSFSAELKIDTSSKNLEEKIFAIEKKLSKEKALFSYVPLVPKVSDVLAYLSTHPALAAKGEEEGINIKNFEYALVKYPKLGSSTDPYKAKVSIEFTSGSQKMAREFREALTHDKVFIDPKEEVIWKVSPEGYFASFHLNPKFGAK